MVQSLVIVTWLRTKRSGVWIPAEAKDYSVLQNVRTSSRTNPAFFSKGTGGLTMGIKRPGCYANRLYSSKALHTFLALQDTRSFMLTIKFDNINLDHKEQVSKSMELIQVARVIDRYRVLQNTVGFRIASAFLIG